MTAVKKDTRGKRIVTKVARSVSFNSDNLSDRKTVSKKRERYIKDVSAKALTAVNG